jgi:bacteriorhodopsin
MNLETAVSLVAGFAYSIFVSRLDAGSKFEDLMPLRYLDWCITTPMLLLVLLIFFTFRDSKRIPVHVYGWILLFNYLMLISGYLGEKGTIDKKLGCLLGFIAYVIMVGIIYVNFIHGKKLGHEALIFTVFLIIWGMYGVAYLLETNAKHLTYNVLDVIAKAFFGMYMWVYYSQLFN